MAKKFIFSPVKAKGLEFDLSMFSECDESPFVVKSSFVRLDDGSKEKGYRKPEKNEKIDLKDENTHVYVVLSIEGQNLDLGIDLRILNASEGWEDCIVVDGEKFSLLNGANISISGKTLKFSIA
jgi:hypothetical protein